MLRGHIYTYTGWGRGRGMPLKSEVIQATNQPAPLSRIDAPSLKREGRRNWHQAAAFLYTAAQTRSDFIHCTVSHSLWAAAGHTGSGEQGKTRHGQLSPLWSSPQRSSSFGLYSPRTLKAQPRVLAAVQNIRREKASVCVCVDWAGFVSRPICERAKDKCNARQPCLLGLFHLRLRSYVGLWWRGRCGWMWIKKEKTESSFYLNQLFFPTESDSVTPVLPLFEGMVVDPVGPGATLRLLHHHHTFCSFGVQSKLKGDESCTLSLPAVDGVPAAGQRWGKVITG